MKYHRSQLDAHLDKVSVHHVLCLPGPSALGSALRSVGASLSRVGLRSGNGSFVSDFTDDSGCPTPVRPRPAGAPVVSMSGMVTNVTLKVAGVHWWYRTRSHAAELTAGAPHLANSIWHALERVGGGNLCVHIMVSHHVVSKFDLMHVSSC